MTNEPRLADHLRTTPSFLASTATFLSAWLGFFGIAYVFSLTAAMWFSFGFIAAALMAFWEAGKRKALNQEHPSS